MPLHAITARLQEAGAALPGRSGGRRALGGGPGRIGGRTGGRVTVRTAWRRPPLNRRTLLLAGLVIAGLVASLYLLLRLTGLSAVQQVSVVGLEGPNAPQLREAIKRAATGQSTLALDDGAIRRAVGRDASIVRLDVSARFPHGVQVVVDQRLAVGAVTDDGRRIAVAADGRLLPQWPAGRLPLIQGGRAAGASITASQRVPVAILAAAPDALRAKVQRIERRTVVRLAGGPTLLFRDGTRLRAKWAAAVAVLSDPAVAGATWIDLRRPEQPLAGRGAAPSLPAAGEPARDLRDAGGVSDAAAERAPAVAPDEVPRAATARGATGSTDASSATATTEGAAPPAGTPGAGAASTPSTAGASTPDAASGPPTGATGAPSSGASDTTSSGASGAAAATSSGGASPAATP
ncbi:hypothetical protein SK069_19955 [Patulibacter brassicae]|uniref:FtsQ-type POTRA domain-containing protein n=1 Tax=Patulibacter brassicae TaxID=1705717 RepID=A0ABU4VPU6_9ACTN|nr:hypothetical protein [Patulibacter brassicae]MDX8153883.1 hypothetical protein [Patulibacter brassicae]